MPDADVGEQLSRPSNSLVTCRRHDHACDASFIRVVICLGRRFCLSDFLDLLQGTKRQQLGRGTKPSSPGRRSQATRADTSLPRSAVSYSHNNAALQFTFT